MLIDPEILTQAGGILKRYKKNKRIFLENEMPENYYQIVTGLVKLANVNDRGKEFIQGIFRPGECFGEPPLFLGKEYFASACAMVDCEIYELPRDAFFKILKKHPEIEMMFLKNFANRIYNRSLASRNIISNDPVQRITGFFDQYKQGTNSSTERMKIPFTRQEIANFTGLRVETVIRTLIRMKEENQVEIADRKIYY